MSAKHIGYNPNKHLLVNDRVYVPGWLTTQICYIRYGKAWVKGMVLLSLVLVLLAATLALVMQVSMRDHWSYGPFMTAVVLWLLFAAVLLWRARQIGKAYEQIDIDRANSDTLYE